jgi:hypothetical protein
LQNINKKKIQNNQSYYGIDMSKIRKGDILLSSNDSISGKLVKLGTSSQFSHASLIVDTASYIHSDLKGVHAGVVNRLYFKRKDDFKILRLKNFDEDKLNIICNFARTEIGKEYTVFDAVNTVCKLQIKNKDKQFCSRLVAQSYEKARINLVDDIDYCTPKDISQSSFLEEVIECKKELSNEELKFIKKTIDLTTFQTQVTNTFLQQIRNVSSTQIQTINDISSYLIKYPKYDKKFNNIIKQCGYLDIFEQELEANPYRYCFEEFIKKFNNDKEFMYAVAKREEEIFSSTLERFKINYSIALKNALQNDELRYFKVLVKLYKKLVGYIEKQKEVNIQIQEYCLQQ